MRMLFRLGLWLSLCVLALPAKAQEQLFRVGVAPHTSSRVILEMYQPLRRHLEQALGETVQIITAPDFSEFARRALAQEYDLAITTGHQARLLQVDAGYLPQLTYKADFKAVVVGARTGAIREPKDLKSGSGVVGLSATSLVTLWGQHWLKNGGVDLPMRYVSAADSVAQLIISGDASAGFMSQTNFQNLSADVRAGLRIIAESASMAGRVYMLNGRDAARQKAIDAALWSFAESEAGREYFAKHKLGGYRKIGPRELEAVDAYAAEVRAELKKSDK
ncbi:MAG TPA: PhnD/SsuA/transferrin family substrate-binding protein [Rhodocyclaceae bacterium]|nr:phosphate/phosphite/phosphonate ABC transporter substrate-binding protein [Rhodocyclaceae bacterium]HNA03281.1 PhnD/SsuA/transferrin family substrate-binding protein [Rhodocyclaceae bacterium]HNB78748.1 PhnD/SsuA/transferrin family substrate-binding protein [Rhodocyclaceae bacterium]HNC60624.1 PhnD/SsuA/transferrin family substrate-binding protein [Rhodocyclaceae bacterium]HNH14215.1 PhnD/SsuA/transferrin family substrate-binding protein [Rhodocyclaceae bacterium]